MTFRRIWLLIPATGSSRGIFALPLSSASAGDDDYFLTYKSKGLMSREEYNLPLTAEAYEHLKPKADGILITKDRYVIPEKDGLFIELDVFHGEYEGVLLAEVEFPTEEAANAYTAPDWFGEDVTYSTRYHNSTMSQGWQTDYCSLRSQ